MCWISCQVSYSVQKCNLMQWVLFSALWCTFLGSFSRGRNVSQRPLPSVDRLAAFADHVAHWALVFGGTSAKNWLILWLVLAT